MSEIDITNLKAPGSDMTLGQTLDVIATADTESFAELMKLAGLDPTKDLRHGNFVGVELNDTDVSGWDFSGSDLTGVDLSQVRNIEKMLFDDRTIFDDVQLPEGITLEQLRALR